MKRNAVYGVGIGINGRDAAMQATQRALDQIGTARPVLALVFVVPGIQHHRSSGRADFAAGRNTLWGFSTLRPLTGDGDQPRSVVVALITGTI